MYSLAIAISMYISYDLFKPVLFAQQGTLRKSLAVGFIGAFGAVTSVLVILIIACFQWLAS